MVIYIMARVSETGPIIQKTRTWLYSRLIYNSEFYFTIHFTIDAGVRHSSWQHRAPKFGEGESESRWREKKRTSCAWRAAAASRRLQTPDLIKGPERGRFSPLGGNQNPTFLNDSANFHSGWNELSHRSITLEVPTARVKRKNCHGSLFKETQISQLPEYHYCDS